MVTLEQQKETHQSELQTHLLHFRSYYSCTKQLHHFTKLKTKP